MFSTFTRLISYATAALCAVLGLLFFITSFNSRRALAVGVLFLLIAVFFAFFPNIANRLRTLASKRVRREPEDSIPLRAITFAGQVVGILGLAQPTGLWVVAIIAIVVLGFGHRYAYLQRAKPNKLVQVLSFVGLHLVFCYMFVMLFAGGPYPQAQIAMLAMAVVSWEIISRLNLYSCFGMSLINLYVAATLSRDLTFGFFLLLYAAVLLAFLWQADSEEGVKGNPVILKNPKSPTANSAKIPISNNPSLYLRAGPAILVAAVMVFIFAPHFAASSIVPPLTLRIPFNKRPSAQIVNPALPVVQIEGYSTESSEYYYGFDSSLDLSYRGGLTDKIMMYVRSPAASYWRSHAFDYYDGRTWTQSDSRLTPVQSRIGQYFFRFINPPPLGDYFAQSFFIAEPMPNVVFTGGTPVQMLFPAEEVSLDSTGGIRAPDTVEAGTQYTVYSLPQNFAPEELWSDNGQNYPAEIRDKYLQLPAELPARIQALALQLTADAPTQYHKVVALRDYLKETYPYDYFPPPQAPNTDAVDQFLFVDKQGVCEHYVSALVVMLRSVGVPARLASGYGSGDFNAVTGYYEVHANQAHAWAEVYFPQHGWVSFDPTPGWNGDPQTGPVRTWVFSSLTDGLDLPKLPIGEAAQAGMAALGALSRPLTIIGLAALIIATATVLIYLFIRWRPARKTEYRGLTDHPARRAVLNAYKRAQRTLRSPRQPPQTVQEHATLKPELDSLAEVVEVAAYRPEPPDEAMVKQARDWNEKPSLK